MNDFENFLSFSSGMAWCGGTGTAEANEYTDYSEGCISLAEERNYGL